MKQYAVIHCQKGKGSGGGQGYHIDRDPELRPHLRTGRPDPKNFKPRICTGQIYPAINAGSDSRPNQRGLHKQ